MNRRRILIIALILAVLAIIALGAYWLFGTSASPADDTAGTLPEIGGEFVPTDTGTDTPNDVIIASTVSVKDVSAFHAFPDGSVIAVRKDGTVAKVASTTVTALSATPVANFASATFSRDGGKILVLTGNQPRSQVNIFDITTASWRVVPGTFRDAVWGPKGNLLATLTPDAMTGKTAVSIYDATLGKTTQTLAVLALGDVSLAWPAADTIIVSDKPTARSTGSAWAIHVAAKTVTLAARGREGFTAVWDPRAVNALALQANAVGTGGRTKLLENGVERALLSFTTVPDKCTFFDLAAGASSTTPYVVCGVPRDQDDLQRRLLPDAYYRREFFTDDVLVGVNLQTRDVDFTAAPPVTSDVTQIQVVGTTMYYVDRATGSLYKTGI